MSSSTLLNPTKKPFYYSLTFQLVAGLVMGGITGLLWPDFGVQLNPLAKGFVSLIKMVAGLIVCLTVVSGFAQMKEGSGVGRTGLIAVVYFEIVSTIALLTGLVLGNIFEPGKGLHIHADASAAVGTPHAASGTADFILSIIPKTVVDALASGIMLQ
ncbi:cation:dicarboxylate symporter family transporter, partial [Klebsiella pasteurii]